MKTAPKTPSETSKRSFHAGMLGLLALSPSVTSPRSLGDRWDSSPSQMVCHFDAETASFSAEPADASTDIYSTATRLASMTKRMKTLLERHGYVSMRQGRTADGSVLLQYPDGKKVDVYPSGDLIVLVRRGDRREVTELRWEDLGRVPSLFEDGGTAS